MGRERGKKSERREREKEYRKWDEGWEGESKRGGQKVREGSERKGALTHLAASLQNPISTTDLLQ